jgi:hypothetical protein
MRRVRAKKEILYFKEKNRKNIGNHKRGDRAVEKHGETERQQRKVENSSNPPWRGSEVDHTTTR